MRGGCCAGYSVVLAVFCGRILHVPQSYLYITSRLDIDGNENSIFIDVCWK